MNIQSRSPYFRISCRKSANLISRETIDGNISRRLRALIIIVMLSVVMSCLGIVGCIPDQPTPANPADAYISNSFANSVSVLNTATGEVVTTIPVGTAPVNPTFTPDCQKVYIANSQAGTLSVIDVNTYEVEKTIAAGGDKPSGLAFTPDGKQLVVTLLGDTVAAQGSVALITLSTGEISPLIPVGAQPERLALSPDGTRAYVANLGGGTMSIIDLALGKVIETISLGNMPFNVLITPDGKLIYVGFVMGMKIAVIDTETNAIVGNIEAPSPNGMAFSQDFQSMFVTNAFNGTVQEISLVTNEVVRSGKVGGLAGFIAVLDDQLAYIARPFSNRVDVLDLANLSIVDRITVELGPSVVTVCRN